MRCTKKGLAVMLAALLALSTQPAFALETPSSGQSGSKTEAASPSDAEREEDKKVPSSDTEKEDGQGTGSQTTGSGNSQGTGSQTTGSGNAQGNENQTTDGGSTQGTGNQGSGSQTTGGGNTQATGLQSSGTKLASTSDAERTEARDEVRFNTGNYEFSVVSQEDFFDWDLGDDYFDDDGSYTINIPEANPFFPYEVQFTYKDKVTEEWFMTPDDSLEIGGHTFYVSAFFDDTAVTQMSLEVGGDTVVVYPEEKEFTNDGGGIMPLSLLPLEEVRLTVDMTAYTPVELTQVAISSIFTGETELTADDKVMWTNLGEDDYTISAPGDIVDLSYDTYYGNCRWEMIVGDDAQLAAENIRYIVTLDVLETEEWLTASVYKQDADGNRVNVAVTECRYDDYRSINRQLRVEVASKDMEDAESTYLALQINPKIFDETQYDELRAYEGEFTSAADAENAEEITEFLFNSDMTQADAGYQMKNSRSQKITLVAYKDGQAVGCLPVRLYLSRIGNYVDFGLYKADKDGYLDYVYHDTDEVYGDVCEQILTLDYGYPADEMYNLVLRYEQAGIEAPEQVTAAYIGLYSTIAEAQAAGAADIKEDLLNRGSGGGYAADYSQGVYFTIFVGQDDSEEQERYQYWIKTEEGEAELSENTWVRFDGLRDKDGNWVNCYVVDNEEDSYADYNFLTILVDENADLTSLAPTFYKDDAINLYAEGSSTPEISGKSFHDFSNGPVQYSASAENKENAKNYWLQVIQAEAGEGKLYINSLADEEAETTWKDGAAYSTREIFIDGLHDHVHDILLANVGTEELPALSVELTSDVVELDGYWTLNGEYGLGGMTTVSGNTSYGALPNLAKIRLKAKAGAEGQDASGTLTIKSGETVLAVLTLTGTVGDPTITTKEIPQAVKYVPYGTMIQNSNKYSWNKVSYAFEDGALPQGMELKANGEIYGVPTETGEFTFTVLMESSRYELAESTRTFTLIVNENTDANVDAATDMGYTVIQRIPDIPLRSTTDHTFVSEGVYDEFVDIFLDGVKLTEGVDYSSESGSTRITIRSQTLKASNQTGTHTLGVEFRTKTDNTLKRAAQNYKVTVNGSSSGNGSGNTSGSGSGSSGGSSDGRNRVDLTNAQNTVITASAGTDSKKGVVNDTMGIVTGNEAGYSHWQQDEIGWKLIYADGTNAAGYLFNQADGNAAEQVAWEKVNGSWYAFGANGYLKSGWIWDYQLNGWYSLTTESGMRSGWYTDSQDNCTYYLDPATGKMALGWTLIDGVWYYFNEVTPVQTWFYDGVTGTWKYNVQSRVKPFGSLYKGEQTPDHYYVGSDGAWDGKDKQD